MGTGRPDEPRLIGGSEEIQRFRDAVRIRIERAAADSGGDLRDIPPAVLLSLLCASGFSAAAGAMAQAPTLGWLSSRVVLGDLISAAIDSVRAGSQGRPPPPHDLEREIYWRIEHVLAAQDQRAAVLRTEIAEVLAETDAMRHALGSAIQTGNDRLRNDVISAIGTLSGAYPEMAFLVRTGDREAAQQQRRPDGQGAEVRTLSGMVRRRSADVRIAREDLAVIRPRQAREGRGGAADPGRGEHWDSGCPYRGLLPFDQEHAGVFFGRQQLTAELIAKVAGRLAGPSMVVVSGASGAGKSSLLHAGLLPALIAGSQLEGSADWPRVVMAPTGDPLTELATRLAALSHGDAAAIRNRLAADPDRAHLVVGQAVLDGAWPGNGSLPPPALRPGRLLLVIDQFEEVFTLAPGRGDSGQQAFIAALCAAASQPFAPHSEPPAVVVIAVRGDFWARCAAHAGLAQLMQDGMFVVGPMTGTELREAITGPAAAAGLQVDADLADTVLADLRTAGHDEAEGTLPLLSQAMMLTWQRRDGNRLTVPGYHETGGVARSVEFGAEAVYEALPDAGQQIAREIFRALALAGPDGQLARRAASRAELAAGRRDAARRTLGTVLEAFASSRLLVLDGDTVQIAHDVLVRAWPRLRGWLDSEQASWVLYTQLQEDAAEWAGHGQDSSFLYRGSQLAAVEQAATRWAADPARYPALSGDESGFLHASQHVAARSVRQRRAAAAVLISLALAVSIASVFALQQRTIALQQRTSAFRQRDQAIYNEVVAEALQASSTDASLAAQLDLVAYRMQPDSGLGTSLLNTENTPLYSLISSEVKGSAGSVAFSPDGRTLATGDGPIVRLWHVNGTARPKPLGHFSGSEVITTMAFSKDGRILASGSLYDAIRLWNVADPAHPRPLGQPFLGDSGTGVNSVSFSPDGRILASGGGNIGIVRLWNVTDPARPRPLGPPLGSQASPYSVAFSPDSRTLAVGSSDGSIKLWNLDDPAHPQLLDQVLDASVSRGVVSITVSPDGHTLVSVDENGTIRLWNVTDPSRPQPLGQLSTGSASSVDSIAFSPDSQTLANGGRDGTIRLWNVTDPSRPQPLGQLSALGASNVDSVAFSPDGRTLASGHYDGTVRLWNIPQAILAGSTVQTVAFSPVSHTLASGQQGTIRLWNIADPAHPRPLGQVTAGTGNVIKSVAFSPDGRILASAQGGTIRLWKVNDPVHPQPLGQVHTGTGDIVYSLAFSPRGNTLASGENGTIRLWNIADPARPHQLGRLSTDNTYAVAFSPDGRMLADGSYGGAMDLDFSTVQLWNVSDLANPKPFGPALASNLDIVSSVAFSSDGRTLAIGVDDGTIRMWNIADPGHPKVLGHPLTTNTINVVTLAAFAPDGDILVTSGEDGTVRLWNISDPGSPKPLGRPLTANTTSVITSLAFSSDDILASSSDDGTISLWNLDINTAIRRICATTANDLTPQLWHTYIPQLPYKPPCQ
jgi:WD40 repeat protein